MKTKHPMPTLRVILLLMLLLCSYRRLEAQYVTIPDVNFVAFLQSHYPSCMNGDQLDTTCTDITSVQFVDFYGYEISDLTGIQYFDGLTSLAAYDVGLTYLPALPPQLQYLNVDTNLLTALPPLPPTLIGFWAIHNSLFTLPTLTAPSYTFIEIANNPISCFPAFSGSIQILNMCGTLITCLPANLNVTTIYNCGDPPPICSYQTDCGAYNFSGRAFKDFNDNCIYDGDDVPLKNIVIEANNGAVYSSTDENGIYHMYVGTPGSYQLSEVVNYPQIEDVICNGNELDATIVDPLDTIVNLDFPNKIMSECPLLTVDVATAIQRRCLNTNLYTVSFCNIGTDTAVGTYLEVKFDPEIIPLSSGLPWSSVSGDVYTWLLGDLPPDSCTSFIITDSISCDAIINQTACVKANIYPQGSCIDTSALWDHSDLAARGYCNATNDTVVFAIVNQGSGAVTYQADAVIYEDDLLLFSFDTTNIQPGDSVIIKQPATGKTYRLEVNQHPNHPGHSMPRDFQELCGDEPYSLEQIVPVPQDDEDDWVEIDCHEIRNSVDPNEKSAQPSGVGVNHYITAADVIDYTIQFQNTGNDTAFNIVISDTIDIAHLDVTSIQPGASSHPYEFNLTGPGIAEFKFNNILLPDSNVNEPASHGFVKYKIRQKPGNTPGMVINNSAAIYFDFNDAVQTNNVFLTVQDKDSIFLPLTVKDPVSLDPTKTVIVFPLPFSDQVTFKVLGKSPESKLQLQISDLSGKIVFKSAKQSSPVLEVHGLNLIAGAYSYTILEDERKIGTGKLIVGK